jgi:hypothetical protein
MPGSSGSGTEVLRGLSPARRALAVQNLPLAEHVVALGLEHIARQRGIIDTLKNGGHDTASAEDLLHTLLETQVLHEEHRDRLRAELGLAQSS